MIYKGFPKRSKWSQRLPKWSQNKYKGSKMTEEAIQHIQKKNDVLKMSAWGRQPQFELLGPERLLGGIVMKVANLGTRIFAPNHQKSRPKQVPKKRMEIIKNCLLGVVGRRVGIRVSKWSQMDQPGTQRTPKGFQKRSKWSQRRPTWSPNRFKGTIMTQKAIQQIQKEKMMF